MDQEEYQALCQKNETKQRDELSNLRSKVIRQNKLLKAALEMPSAAMLPVWREWAKREVEERQA